MINVKDSESLPTLSRVNIPYAAVSPSHVNYPLVEFLHLYKMQPHALSLKRIRMLAGRLGKLAATPQNHYVKQHVATNP